MQDDGPSNGSASIADGCVITGDCDDDQVFGASRKTFAIILLWANNWDMKNSTLCSRAQLIVITFLVTVIIMICMKTLTPNFNPRY
jgi:hypothetical protein